LYEVVKDHVPNNVLALKNKAKTWAYGYNKKYDMVVISRTGQIGEVYEIEKLKVALPPTPDKVAGSTLGRKDQKWERKALPVPLRKIKETKNWNAKPLTFKREWIGYIDKQFEKRKAGHWFMNNGKKVYMTGSQYMYLQWAKIDVGHPDFRESNRIFFIFWEAVKADDRCFGMCYVKNRRSGFSFMGSSEIVNTATVAKDSIVGMLSKTGGDARAMFTEKVVPINVHYPFFFRPIQDGMDKPKTEISYRVPAVKLTKNSLLNADDEEGEEEIEGLETIINWLATSDNSYDSKKLLLLVHDESGKWEKPNNIVKNWRVTKTCLRLGRKIIGKCMMGSTVNALQKGGNNFKELYSKSDITNRTRNDQTKSGLYSIFIPMEFNMEGFIDEFGYPVTENPDKPVMGIDGEMIKQGAIDYWEGEVESFGNDSDGLNEWYRQYPRTESHAFRDESKESLFNLTKLYEQVDYNDGLIMERHATRGNFRWKDNIKDTVVEWIPSPAGRFITSWIPPKNLQNAFALNKRGQKYPLNEYIGAFGCDSYDISGAVGGGGSKGALHGSTKYNASGAPCNKFFLEYIAKPPKADIFFEDVIMALVFYGMPVLAENAKSRLLYAMLARGYRLFSLDRPDKPTSKLSVTEKEIGGTPNSSPDLIQAHASALEAYIEDHIGYDREGRFRESDEIGEMPFQRTLDDWIKFDINNRTSHDASISSGLSLIANQKNMYKVEKERKKISLNFAQYTNKGTHSKRVNHEDNN
tara:strand:+ start:1820 stop:4072 length:2253 start_codon:yes stop_codon:yes gene_type:complete